jgi:hypothetical protein
MTHRRTLAALFGAVMLLATAADSDAQPPAACLSALNVVFQGVAGGADPCLTLAVGLATASPTVVAEADAILKPGAVPMGAVFSQRDLQARHPQQPATGGTPAQGHAIPSVQPAGLASGTIAGVGTDAGSDALAALSVNPALLFLGDAVTRQLAQYSRFLDLTAFVPVTNPTRLTTATGGSTIKYYGARVRLNVQGVSAGNQLWADATRLLETRISRAGRNAERVRAALARAPDLTECARALMASPSIPAAIAANCGGPVTIEVDLTEANDLRAAPDQVRRRADARYFGADIRVDVGDPTMGAVANASGTALFAGLSYGRRVFSGPDQTGSYGFRSRLGIRNATLDVTRDTDFAVEGGLGFELAREIDTQEVNASVAVEFRQGNAPANLTDQFQTDFVMVRGSVIVPLTPQNSISINFGKPVSGNVSPVLSVNFNWGLLLSNALTR